MRVRLTYKRSMQIALAVGGICLCAFKYFQDRSSVFSEMEAKNISGLQKVFPHLYVYDVCKWNPPGLLAVFTTAIGKAAKGAVVSLTRQILFLLPLIIIFPIFIGIDGVMYAGPIADGTAAVVTIVLARVR